MRTHRITAALVGVVALAGLTAPPALAQKPVEFGSMFDNYAPDPCTGEPIHFLGQARVLVNFNKNTIVSRFYWEGTAGGYVLVAGPEVAVQRAEDTFNYRFHQTWRNPETGDMFKDMFKVTVRDGEVISGAYEPEVRCVTGPTIN